MIGIACTMSPGAFSGEISFEIESVEGSHTGLASRLYFFKKNKEPVGKEAVGNNVPGYIVIRTLFEQETGSKNSVLASIPDGEVVRVKKDQIQVLESAPHVPVGS